MPEERKSEIVKIDIKRLIQSQENKFVKNLPGFIINLIRRLVHEREINDVIEKDHMFRGIDFIRANMRYLNIKVETKGTENLPVEGRYIFVCNHALGGIDFYAAILSVYDRFPEIKVIANEILNDVDNLKELFLPVNVFKKNGHEVKVLINSVLSSEKLQLMTFPAGEVSRKIDGKVKDKNWNKSFIRNAVEHRRDVIPILIDSKNSKFFYRVARLRELIGIKAPAELILLPHELFKKRNSTIKVIIGKPISYTKFDQTKTEFEWAQQVKEDVYRLGI